MPLPMVHLAAAVQLASRHQQFPSPAFLLGSLSPDAIHQRPNSGDSEKAVTHLNVPPDTPDHAAVRRIIEQYKDLPAPLPSFAAGYAAHILTDRLWLEMIGSPFRDRFTAEIGFEAMRDLYYRETDQIDCNLYRHEPWRQQVWEYLCAAEAVDFPPLLSATEIDGWRVRTLEWFDDPTHEPNITPEHITDARVADFIQEVTGGLETQFAAWDVGAAFL